MTLREFCAPLACNAAASHRAESIRLTGLVTRGRGIRAPDLMGVILLRGSIALENLARIEDAVGVDRLLDGAHQCDFLRTAREVQEFALQRADAVLGRDRTPPPGHEFVDRALDFK